MSEILKQDQQWWRTALFGSCPACGKGPLFSGLLGFHKVCPNCGADHSGEDAGDGPTVFVILIAGALLVPMTLILLLATKWSPVLVILAMMPVAFGLCIYLLRLFRAGLYALQRHHRAGEGRLKNQAAQPKTSQKPVMSVRSKSHEQ